MNTKTTFKGHGIAVGQRFTWLGRGEQPTASGILCRLDADGQAYRVVKMGTGETIARFGKAMKVWASPETVAPTQAAKLTPMQAPAMALNPKQRAALKTSISSPEGILLGHGKTLNALVRRGLAIKDGRRYWITTTGREMLAV